MRPLKFYKVCKKVRKYRVFCKKIVYKLSGMPEGQENRVTRLEMTVTAAGAISTLEIQEIDGAITRFTFTGEQPDATIPAETFHFTPPAGVPKICVRVN